MPSAYTVLVVDDEPPIRRFLRTSLGAIGHHIVTADNAALHSYLVGAEASHREINAALNELRDTRRSAETRLCR